MGCPRRDCGGGVAVGAPHWAHRVRRESDRSHSAADTAATAAVPGRAETQEEEMQVVEITCSAPLCMCPCSRAGGTWAGTGVRVVCVASKSGRQVHLARRKSEYVYGR